MDPKQNLKQMIDFNKKAFDNAFSAFAALQDETNSLVSRFLDKSTWIPPEGKKVITQMSETYLKSRNDLKFVADESFRKASEYFVPADKKQ
jgi:hypothetical protein